MEADCGACLFTDAAASGPPMGTTTFIKRAAISGCCQSGELFGAEPKVGTPSQLDDRALWHLVRRRPPQTANTYL